MIYHLWSKLKNKHFLVLAGNASIAFVGIVMTFILFRVLNPEKAGLYFYVLSFSQLCESARSGFLSTATVKYYAGAESDRAKTVLGSVWLLALRLSGIILLINLVLWFLFHETNNESVALSIKWFGLTYLSTLPADVTFWKLQAEEKYGTMFWYRLLNSGSTIVTYLILILFNKMTIENALLYNFLTNCMASGVGVILGMSGISYIVHRSKDCIKELYHYGKYTLGTTSFSMLLGYVDIWIINYLLGPASVAVYKVGMSFMAFVELPLRSFTTTGMSEMAIQYNRRNYDEVAGIFKKYAGMLTIAFIPAAAIAYLCADFVTMLVGGTQYHNTEASSLYQMFMIIAILSPMDRFNGLTLDILHHTRINFYKVIIMLSVKVAGNLLFITLLGSIYGVPLSLLLSTLSGLLFGYYILNKYIPHTFAGIFADGYRETKIFANSLFRKSDIDKP